MPAGWGRAWRSGWLVGDGHGAAFAEHVTLLHAPSSTPRGLRTRDWQHLCSLETRPGPAGAKPAFQPTPRLFAWKEAVKRTPFHSVLARHPEALLDDTVGTQMPEPQSGGSPLPTAPVLPNSTPTLVTDLGIPRGGRGILVTPQTGGMISQPVCQTPTNPAPSRTVPHAPALLQSAHPAPNDHAPWRLAFTNETSSEKQRLIHSQGQRHGRFKCDSFCPSLGFCLCFPQV